MIRPHLPDGYADLVFGRGYEARGEGARLSENPHPAASRDAMRWSAGWHARDARMRRTGRAECAR